MIRITGEYEKLGDINYFTPDALPPKNPAFIMNEEIANLYDPNWLDYNSGVFLKTKNK